MRHNEQVWIIDDENTIRWVLERALSQANISCRTFSSAKGVVEQLSVNKPQAIISDIRMPGCDGLELLHQIHEVDPELPVIIMTAHSDLDSAVSAYHQGAFEYLPKPFDMDEAVELIQRALKHSQKMSANTDYQPPSLATPEIVGEAPAMQEVFRAIGRLSRSNITVLINGESGTGKELVAQALHKHSPRANNPFIALNMAAIPKDLIESELFGHEKGSFTGANQSRRGRFEQADGGSLFLDEIGDMPLDAQTRLLRVLADGEFYRVGGMTPVKVDVRIITATHQNLENLVKEGRFREDLFHRLNVIRIQLPALRERREDIVKLAEHFLKQASQELSGETKILLPETQKYVSQLPWPGNVRQLQNVCRWLTVMASGREIHTNDLPSDLMISESVERPMQQDWEQCLRQWVEDELSSGREGIIDRAIPKIETILIESALKHTGGRKRDAANLLGWGRNTLTRKIKELNMDV